ncbi:co-regulatory protein PtrA N-terminal domain-containing protein [uncultured Pseudomonas sp.]|uniref:co-regulatory protein PtrA N-terminal domain-containing protein n=1 Tax=uncultured Pseudomonas sp. TaxID=114707 RepID=UPI002639A2FF|nr:co-regulatory protein PtrA N-terminal domain-containing protein [uncultured Pseudomonas sp.]
MKLLKSLFLVGSLLLASVAWAEGGAGRLFERIESMRDKAEAVLVQAEKAPASERHVHMKEHMKMLGEIMNQLHSEHPAPGISTEEHLAWMEQHDKLVDDVLAQMMREHKLMMADKECHP